jgi:hypothetical protein
MMGAKPLLQRVSIRQKPAGIYSAPILALLSKRIGTELLLPDECQAVARTG